MFWDLSKKGMGIGFKFENKMKCLFKKYKTKQQKTNTTNFLWLWKYYWWRHNLYSAFPFIKQKLEVCKVKAKEKKLHVSGDLFDVKEWYLQMFPFNRDLLSSGSVRNSVGGNSPPVSHCDSGTKTHRRCRGRGTSPCITLYNQWCI